MSDDQYKDPNETEGQQLAIDEPEVIEGELLTYDSFNATNHDPAKVKENLEIWNLVRDTDPRFTKAAKLGARTWTSISPQYNIQRATELWGPIGKGWGWKVTERGQVKTLPILDAQGKPFCDSDGHTLFGITVTITLSVWYKDNNTGDSLTGIANSIIETPEQTGACEFIYQTNAHKIKQDTDAWKKATTSAVSKCLSGLGFSADVFLGEYDDQMYVKLQETKSKLSQSANTEQKTLELNREKTEWFNKIRRLIATAQHMNEMLAVYEGAINTLAQQKKVRNATQEEKARVDAGIATLTRDMQKAKLKLTPKKGNPDGKTDINSKERSSGQTERSQKSSGEQGSKQS